jgi:hypothetical protein
MNATTTVLNPASVRHLVRFCRTSALASRAAEKVMHLSDLAEQRSDVESSAAGRARQIASSRALAILADALHEQRHALLQASLRNTIKSSVSSVRVGHLLTSIGC